MALFFCRSEIDIISENKKEAKAKNRRQQTVVVGDLRPLEDTLPTLDYLTNLFTTTDTKKSKSYKYVSFILNVAFILSAQHLF